MTAPRQPDEASASAIAYSKVAAGVMKTFRQNRSKMTNMTEAELTVILNRGLAVVDQPLPEIVFDLEPLDFDVDIDIDFEAESMAKPSAVAHVRRAPAPSKACSSRATSITCRIPGVVLAAIKAEAQKMGIPYQTLMNRILQLAVVG